MCSESNNSNLRKLARLEKLLELSKGKPEFEGLRQKYEALYDTISASVPATTSGEPIKKTRWGIPVPDGWDPNDPVFQRHPRECDCFRYGVLRCGVPCVWAWPPGAKIGDKATRLRGV